MSKLFDLINDYEQKLLSRIEHLENENIYLKNQVVQLTTTHTNHRLSLESFLLNEVKAPPELECPGRDFATDFKTLLIKVSTLRAEGKQSRDADSRLIPFIPALGWMFRWLDGENGCPNYSKEKQKEYCDNLNKWVDALLVEFNKLM